MLSFGLDPLDLFDELREYGMCTVVADTSATPDLSALDPRILHLRWRIDLVTELSDKEVRDVFFLVPDDARVEVTRLETEDASPPSPAAPAPAADKRSSKDGDAADRSVRVATSKLDHLVELVGELVIAQSRLQQHVGSAVDEELREITEQLERLTTDLRDSTLGIRMRPVGKAFVRFQRLTRDIARNLDKEVVFETEGDDVELDKSVLDRLVDPLVHLLRNALDHGIETPERRRAAGKSPVGHVRLRAAQHYGTVIIELVDDGAGIDPEKILATARRKGLVAPDVELPAPDAIQLVLRPGFSTKDAVSDLSGRGVGLDVVRRTIEGLNGQLRIESSLGEGTRFILSLPLTLSIIEGLMVRVGAETYVLPLAQVDRVLEIREDDRQFTAWHGLFSLASENVPYVRLRHWFGSQGHPSAFEKVVVVQTQSHPLACVVDEVLGHGQIVVKEMLDVMQRRSGVSGATILGDGRVALILDSNRLLSLILQRNDSQRLGSANRFEQGPSAPPRVSAS